MTVDTTHGHDVCELTLPATRDGSTMYELIRHFTENVRKTGEEPFGKTLWLLRQQYPQVWSETLEAHGGWSLYSDRMVIDRLNSLSNSLVNKVEELRTIDYDEIISRIPVEQVDMDKLLRKYTALLVDVYGKDKTLDLLKDIVQNPEERKQVVEESQNRPMVMMNKYNGQVEMGMSDLFEDMGWLDNPNYLDITGRLTDIHIYRSVRPDDPHRIRCKVDGVQQVSVLLTPAQDRYWQGARLHDMCVQARYKLAGETFSSLLLGKEQQQQRSEGFKR